MLEVLKVYKVITRMFWVYVTFLLIYVVCCKDRWKIKYILQNMKDQSERNVLDILILKGAKKNCNMYKYLIKLFFNVLYARRLAIIEQFLMFR